ncbi:hypothetical protein B0H14DRAFT_3489217 [Mycena olivaceomarginata]|nr:hypothetical protein B0H14DRAFT_3489217 [Mycena olivaceomarginata]
MLKFAQIMRSAIVHGARMSSLRLSLQINGGIVFQPSTRLKLQFPMDCIGTAHVGYMIKALTGERIHGQFFVCGPKGAHYQPALPPYPQEWNYFIRDSKTARISRKLNNICS